ncbi:MAG TPA: hypothetical protein VGK69_06655 [Gaiellaceae bacterium]
MFPQCSLGGLGFSRRAGAQSAKNSKRAPSSSSSRDASGSACVEVREQKRRLLLGPPLRASAEQDDGRTLGAAGREERREVGVGGNEDPVFHGRAAEDLLVGC